MFVRGLKRNGLLLEAYSPLGSEEKVKKTLEVPAVCLISFFITYIATQIKSIAKELGISPAQLYISWQVQRSVRPDLLS